MATEHQTCGFLHLTCKGFANYADRLAHKIGKLESIWVQRLEISGGLHVIE